MAVETLPTLTLHGIWPWAIVHLGKRVENRSERFARMIAGQIGDGWLAIHAGKNIGNRPGRPGTCEAFEAVSETAELTADWHSEWGKSCTRGGVTHDEPGAIFQRGDERRTVLASEIITSAVVAVCRVRGVLPPGVVYPWKVPDSAALKLDEVRVLPEPVPCGGSQGLWRLPDDVFEAVKAQGVLRG